MATSALCAWGGFAMQVIFAGALHLWPKHRWIGWFLSGAGWLVFVVAFARWYSDRHPGTEFLWIAVAGAMPLPLATFILWCGAFRRSPLRIIFDPTNSDKRFWSVEYPKDKDGSLKPGAFWEYRVLLKNRSRSKTVRNVRSTVEGKGFNPKRPEFAVFDITQTTTMDLAPQAQSLIVVLRWPYPASQVGMVSGEKAYGPLTIIVTADDIPAISRTFRFDYARTPMIYD